MAAVRAMHPTGRLAVPGLAVLCLLLGFDTAAGQRMETGFLDRVVTVTGHQTRYQVYVPKEYTEAVRWPVILFLHGAGERGSDGLLQTAVGLGPAIRRTPARYPAIAVFPQAPVDSAWTGAPAEAAMAALRATLAEFATDSARVYLTGMSMGGNGAWHLAYRHPETFAAVVPICGWVSPRPDFPGPAAVVPEGEGPPFEALARRLAGMPIWVIHGEVDAVVPVEESRQAAAALEAAGGDVRYTELVGVAHNAWDPAYGSPAVIRWLFTQRRPRQDGGSR